MAVVPDAKYRFLAFTRQRSTKFKSSRQQQIFFNKTTKDPVWPEKKDRYMNVRKETPMQYWFRDISV